VGLYSVLSQIGRAERLSENLLGELLGGETTVVLVTETTVVVLSRTTAGVVVRGQNGIDASSSSGFDVDAKGIWPGSALAPTRLTSDLASLEPGVRHGRQRRTPSASRRFSDSDARRIETPDWSATWPTLVRSAVFE
jgi:hypothetical protein